MKKDVAQSTVILYQAKNGAIELRGDVSHDTIWATQAQIAEVFGVERSVVTKHIRNIYKESELEEKTTCAKFAQVQTEGGRRVERFVEHYNLDTIISVGYRVNSKTATQFRQWATKTLRDHITRGFTLNRKRIGRNYDAFMKAVGDVQTLLPAHVALDPAAVLELIKEFAYTWVSLQAYDTDTLAVRGPTKKVVCLTSDLLMHAIATLRQELMAQGTAIDLFALEREAGSVQGIVGNVMQAFGGKDLYASVEEKAAHLLYFMVKNHPFSDGNKRSGAFAFVWFLRKFGAKRSRSINPAALTALTLLIAESDPKKKEQMVALVTTMLA